MDRVDTVSNDYCLVVFVPVPGSKTDFARKESGVLPDFVSKFACETGEGVEDFGLAGRKTGIDR